MEQLAQPPHPISGNTLDMYRCTPLRRSEIHDMANRILTAGLSSGHEKIIQDFNRLMEERNCMLRLIRAAAAHIGGVQIAAESPSDQLTALRKFVEELEEAT